MFLEHFLGLLGGFVTKSDRKYGKKDRLDKHTLQMLLKEARRSGWIGESRTSDFSNDPSEIWKNNRKISLNERKLKKQKKKNRRLGKQRGRNAHFKLLSFHFW